MQHDPIQSSNDGDPRDFRDDTAGKNLTELHGNPTPTLAEAVRPSALHHATLMPANSSLRSCGLAGWAAAITSFTRGAQLDLTAEDFFEALSQDMIERGTTSRELVALEFDPESGEISVFGGAAVHAADYPALKTILEKIGKICVADEIGVHQLRRITFLEEHITLEWVSRTGKWELHTYPIEERPH